MIYMTSNFHGSTTDCKLVVRIGYGMIISKGVYIQGIGKSAFLNRDIVGKITPTIPSAS